MYTIFRKHKGKKVIMKFTFYNSNIVTIFLMNLWVTFHPLHTAKVNLHLCEWP